VRASSSASVNAFSGGITSCAFDRSSSEYGTSANGCRFFSSSRKCANCVTSDSATAADGALGSSVFMKLTHGQTPAIGATVCVAIM
jgi:hypothetical protein